MRDLTAVIPEVRECVGALLRLHRSKVASTEEGEVLQARFEMGFGSGFCVATDRYFVTAYHNLNGGQPGPERDHEDRFYVFTVPGNGEPAYHFPVVAVPVERPELDIAVLELGPCAIEGIHIPALPVSFSPRPDGTRVLTVGFPAPEVYRAEVDPDGTYRGGQFFLKSHANEGIVSAQYPLGGVPLYELNVGWHHGESGGPIVCQDDPVAVFSIMQQYRNVQSPHGILAGPHRGIALSSIASDLAGLGITGV